VFDVLTSGHTLEPKREGDRLQVRQKRPEFGPGFELKGGVSVEWQDGNFTFAQALVRCKQG
jgi:hypothetical protein